jgi:hypothetical protein
MITAKCNKCGGTALGDTFQQASSKINHAVGLSRGIKCGDNYNMVCEIKDSTTKKPTPKTEIPKEPTITPKESPVEQKSKPTKSKSFK